MFSIEYDYIGRHLNSRLFSDRCLNFNSHHIFVTHQHIMTHTNYLTRVKISAKGFYFRFFKKHSKIMDLCDSTQNLTNVTHEPTLPMEPTHEPTLSMQPTHEPKLPMQPTHEPTLPMQPTHEPKLPMQPTHEPTLPMQPTHEPTLPMQPAHEPTLPMQPRYLADSISFIFRLVIFT